MNPRVIAVVPTDNYRLRLTFTNGEIGVFDCAHLLTFGVFRELNDIEYFKRGSVANGTVVCRTNKTFAPTLSTKTP